MLRIASERTRRAITPTPAIQREVRRDQRAWKGLYGIWRGRNIKDPVAWQRSTRKAWARKLP